VKEIQGLNVDAFLKCIHDPYDTQSVFDLFGGMVTSGRYAELSQCYVHNAKCDCALMELFEKRYAPRFPTIPEMEKLPANSLGRVLAEHLVRNKIDLGFTGIDISKSYGKQETFEQFLRTRSMRTHDILHVLIGADTTPICEGQVAAFGAAQYSAPSHAMIQSFLLAHLQFFDPAYLHEGMKAMHAAFAAGLKAAPYLGVAWEEFLGEDIGALRKRFGIDPPGRGDW
jgi:ubiquinone biosynthesis protein Coq4